MTASERIRRARQAQVFEFRAVGMDVFDRRQHTPADGTLVIKTQPYGCPKNGTMGHTYIADAQTGEFIGLVLEASLQRVSS